MQQSIIYNLIKKFPYPFIVRHNREEVYSQHPQVDYITLWRYSVRLSVAGFFIGKFLKKPLTFAFIMPLPLIAKFLFDEYRLMKQGKYQEIYQYKNWELKEQINKKQQMEKQQKQIKKKKLEIQTDVKLKNNLSVQKTTSTKQFVKRLPKQYF